MVLRGCPPFVVMAEGHYEQKKVWAVCQICGATILYAKAEAEGWLVSPYRLQPDLNVVRCFRHISYRALQNCFAGQTKYWIAKMREGKARAATLPRYNAALEPFPLKDEV